jgi:hypothetical protein
MSEKLKALTNAIFVQLNRYERQQPDFSADTFIRDCENFFSELDRLDLSADGGAGIDEHLKQRINTIPRNSQAVSLVVANLLALYFWYVRRPPQQCQNAFLAAKKLRGIVDDSQFVEQAIAPLVFGGKLRGFGKRDRDFRSLILHRTAQIAVNFRESDQINVSATRIVRSDSWQKKMLHIAALNQRGRKDEIRSFAPSDELRVISEHNDFAAWYLRTNEIYKGESAILRALKHFFSSLGNTVFSVFNWRFVLHVCRNRWPVYLVYLLLCAAFIYGALNIRVPWEKVHRDKAAELLAKKAEGTR